MSEASIGRMKAFMTSWQRASFGFLEGHLRKHLSLELMNLLQPVLRVTRC